MTEITRFTSEEVMRLAGSAVAKMDLLGARGTTLCTCHEIEAMAVLLVMTGALQSRITAPQSQPR